MSTKINVKLTNFQKQKIKKAVREGNNVKVRISSDQLDGDDVLIVDKSEADKIEALKIKKISKDIKLSSDNLKEMREGGFLSFLAPILGSVVGSMITGSGVPETTRSARVSVDEGSGLYRKHGSGLYLRKGSGLYLKSGRNLYDLTDTKYGSGFFGAIMKAIPAIAKKILPQLGIGALLGASSEGASQIIKKIAGRNGGGLYLGHNNQMYDLTDTHEGNGLLGKLLGAPGGKVPILGDIPLLGALF